MKWVVISANELLADWSKHPKQTHVTWFTFTDTEDKIRCKIQLENTCKNKKNRIIWT